MSDDLFVITNVFVDGKNLHKLLRASAGLVVKMDVPRPVINAVVEKTGVIRAASGAGNIREKFTELVQKFAKGTDLPTSQLRTLMKQAGGSEGGIGYYTQALKDAKILKLKERGLWTVI